MILSRMMKCIKRLSSVMVLGLLSLGQVMAQEEEIEGMEEMAGEEISVLEMVLQHSGWPGFIIILLSIFAIFLAIRFFIVLRRSEMLPVDFINSVEDDVADNNVGEAMKKCMEHDSILAKILEDGLRELKAGYDEMISSAEDSAETESIRLQQKIGWLSIIGAIAPMLGLMGTVLGMLGAFGVIAAAETQPPPRLLAGQIQMALVTTAQGLIVGVPVLVVYAALKNKATAVFLDMGLVVTDILDRFKHTEITPDMIEDIDEAINSMAQPEMGAEENLEKEELDEMDNSELDLDEDGLESLDEEPPPPPGE